MKAVKFKNFTNEDFEWKWDGNSFKFPAGIEIYLEEDQAHHFAKHLVDRELNKTNTPTNNQQARKALGVQCFPTEEAVTPVEAINLNETKKKSTRVTKKVEEEEFSDLKNK